MQQSIIISLIISVLTLMIALITAYGIKKKEIGNDTMKKIAGHIKRGAMAFIKREYMIIAFFMIALSVVIFFALGLNTAICFVFGAVSSMLAGYIGMRTATSANVRCAKAAEKGLFPALKIAFSGGSVMGLSVVGLGVMGLSLSMLIFKGQEDIANIITGFSLGASFIALFSRVGGGIYTKAADVGADLVGKVEAGIPEDDPRNPAVIADNVGDNVGDVAGMGADLFESYVGSIVSVITLAFLSFGKIGEMSDKYITYTFLLVAFGIAASLVGTFVVKALKKVAPQKVLNTAEYTAMAIFAIATLLAGKFILGNYKTSIVVIAGLLAGGLIGKVTEIYTSADYKSVKIIAKQSQTGTATNIISGLSAGMMSTAIPILIIAIAIFIADKLDPVMGVGLVAVGMLATTGITVAVDAYGPIADNAGGIAQMSSLSENVRETTDSLDSVGNTTAAIGKGFAIGSAALTSMALFKSYCSSVDLTEGINIVNSKTVIGLLIGAMLPFLFSSLAINAVSSAANSMILEVRRQFKEIKGILEGTKEPDYVNCIDISTKAALKSMIAPAVLAVISPLAVGLLLGTEALGGLLAGSLASGTMMAIFMSNSGGAWDNAKKYIETGEFDGKGSESHKAAVIGDTVGDPLKDTAGPSINILIKLMSIVALVFAPMF